MTLGDFLNMLSGEPITTTMYFAALPLSAALALLLNNGKGHLSPWKYFYTIIVFGACIPGIFSVTLSIYQFLFGHRDILQANLYTQIMPVVSMFLTLFLVNRSVDFRQVPGFDKLSSLIIVLISIFTLMWIVDRTHIYSIVRMPFSAVVFIVGGSILVLLFMMKRFFNKPNRN